MTMLLLLQDIANVHNINPILLQKPVMDKLLKILF